MIVELPFIYSAEVIPPRHRNPRSARVLDRLPLKIRTLSPDTFPVALRLVEADRVPIFDEDGSVAAAFEQKTDLRWDGRALFQPFGLPEEDRGLSAGEVEKRFAAARHNPFSSEQGLFNIHGHSTADKALRHGQIEGTVVSDDRRERIAKLVGRTLEVILCDGTFWVPAPEPVWVTSLKGGHPYVEAKIHYGFDLENNSANLYRADRLEVAIDSFRPIRGVRRDPTVLGVVDVLLPEAVQLRLDDRQLIRCAKSMLELMVNDLHKVDVPFFAAYAGLRDALEEKGDDVVSPELADRIREMIEQMPDTDQGAKSWRKKRLSDAYDRWADEMGRLAGPDADHPASSPRQPGMGG